MAIEAFSSDTSLSKDVMNYGSSLLTTLLDDQVKKTGENRDLI